MTARTILRYPDQKLAEICAPVVEFDANLRQLVDDLIDTMRTAPGVGITAAHIGVTQRVFVLELAPGKVEIYINPVIAEFSQKTSRYTEGSVSMPGMTDEVERPASISVTYQTLDGTLVEQQADGFQATCIQHEVDQLDGIFWIKRLSRLKRDRLTKKWEKQEKLA